MRQTSCIFYIERERKKYCRKNTVWYWLIIRTENVKIDENWTSACVCAQHCIPNFPVDASELRRKCCKQGQKRRQLPTPGIKTTQKVSKNLKKRTEAASFFTFCQGYGCSSSFQSLRRFLPATESADSGLLSRPSDVIGVVQRQSQSCGSTSKKSRTVDLWIVSNLKITPAQKT